LIKSINAITLLIVIVGGINWAIVGIFDFDVVTALFGTATAESAPPSATARVSYVIIGLSAAWQFGVLLRRLAPARD